MSLFLNLDKTQLSTKQQQVLDVVEKRGFKIAYMSIGDLAKEAEVSVATVSRFWELAGFRNFKAFKDHVKNRIESTPENKLRNFMLDVGDGDLFNRVIEQNYDYLFQTHTHLNRQDLADAVQAIVNCQRIFLHAPSSSEGLGTLLSHRLKRFGIPVERMAKSGHDIFETMIHFERNDLIVIFQFVKLLPESKVLLDYANELGIETILFTDQLIADMNKLANYVLYADRGNIWDFHSMIGPLTVVETLIMLVGQELEERSIENLEKLSLLRRKYRDIIPN